MSVFSNFVHVNHNDCIICMCRTKFAPPWALQRKVDEHETRNEKHVSSCICKQNRQTLTTKAKNVGLGLRSVWRFILGDH